MKICHRCGKNVKETDRFCKFCGFYFPLFEVELKKLVVVHADIEGFTRFSSTSLPETVGETLKNIFSSLISIFESYGIFINQFYGDEIVGLMGLSGIKENFPEKALEMQANVHSFFKNYKIKISMEYGDLFLTFHKTDGSSYLLVCGEPEERAREGIKFIKGGETAIGINLLKYLNKNIKTLLATNSRNDIFILKRV